MVFGRFDVASSTNNSVGLNIYSSFYSPRHGASRAAIQHHLTNNPQGQKTRNFFANSIQSSPYCRRHHRKDCQRTCCTLAKLQQQQQIALEQKKKLNNNYYSSNNNNNNNVRKPEQKRVAGLADAIPVFLKCSAISFKDIAKNMVEKGEIMETSENRVPEGWYNLLIEMMTQAVIESYLCDGTEGVDTILDVFSYGDDNDEEDSKENIKDEDNTSTQQRQQSPTQEYQDEILFVNTPEFVAFKKAKEERLQELLTMCGTSMEQHLVKLAAKHPLIIFERQMTHYIARSQKLLEDPKLSRSAEDIGFLIPPATSAYADGSLSMPVSDGEDDDDIHFPRLEEIKEEEEDHVPKIVESAQQQQPERKRHEKMKLATITSSMDEDDEEPIDYNNSNSYNGRVNHLPSPPPSVAVSRSSTVSPMTSTVPMMEDELTITEAAQILMMSNKKHKYSEVKSESQHQDIGREKLGQRTVKKIKV
ncbi:hypothetical protein BGZ76_010685 [Entomortierella beljakovae]|nr:hypothetical protein BGZ76_010685 [Entomortierella beljakovae]